MPPACKAGALPFELHPLELMICAEKHDLDQSYLAHTHAQYTHTHNTHTHTQYTHTHNTHTHTIHTHTHTHILQKKTKKPPKKTVIGL